MDSKEIRHFETGRSIARFGSVPVTSSEWIWLGFASEKKLHGLQQLVARAISCQVDNLK